MRDSHGKETIVIALGVTKGLVSQVESSENFIGIVDKELTKDEGI